MKNNSSVIARAKLMMKNKIIVAIIFSAMLFFIPRLGLPAGFDNIEFQRANELYKQADYAKASVVYEKINGQGFESGNFYYNLGNSYFKQGLLAKALINYTRARFFIPGNSDLKSNYEYVKALLNPQTNAFLANRWQKLADRIFSGFSLQAQAALLLWLWWLFFICLTLVLFFQGSRKFLYPVLAGLVIFFILGVISFNIKKDNFKTGAMVIASEVEVKFEPLSSATAYFTLNQGSLVRVEEKGVDWYKIKRDDAKFGWVKKADLEMLDNSLAVR